MYNLLGWEIKVFKLEKSVPMPSHAPSLPYQTLALQDLVQVTGVPHDIIRPVTTFHYCSAKEVGYEQWLPHRASAGTLIFLPHCARTSPEQDMQ